MHTEAHFRNRHPGVSASMRRLKVWTRGIRAIRLLAATAGLAALALGLGCGSDASAIIFVSDRDGNAEIYSVDLSGEAVSNLTKTTGDEYDPVVSPDRRLVAFRSDSPDGTAIEVMSLKEGSRTRLALGTGAPQGTTWSPDSDRVAYVLNGEAPSRVRVANSDGSQSMVLTSVPGDEVGDWSPDGKSVVFSVNHGQDRGIYLRNPDGVNEFRLTDGPDTSPIWSPDSKKIAFLSTRDGNLDIFVMKPDGTGQRNLTTNEAPDYGISWSPDGKRLLFVSERDGNAEIYVMKVDRDDQERFTSTYVRLTHNKVRDVQPVWSPDGKRIAFVSYLDDDAELFVMNADGTDQIRLTNNEYHDTHPTW